MKYRKLGRTNFEISEMGYGAWGIGGTQWLGGSDDESLAALRRAIELGLNFIDTALAYGAGHSEQLVGQVVREAGREIYVATKVPPKNQLWPAQPGIGIEQVFPYDYILRSTERSLQNLGVETIATLAVMWLGAGIAPEGDRTASARPMAQEVCGKRSGIEDVSRQMRYSLEFYCDRAMVASTDLDYTLAPAAPPGATAVQQFPDAGLTLWKRGE